MIKPSRKLLHPWAYDGSYWSGKRALAEGKKEPLQDQQVYDQEDGVDPGERGVSMLGTDVVEPVTIFALAEFTFDGDALQVFLPALRFFL